MYIIVIAWTMYYGFAILLGQDRLQEYTITYIHSILGYVQCTCTQLYMYKYTIEYILILVYKYFIQKYQYTGKKLSSILLGYKKFLTFNQIKQKVYIIIIVGSGSGSGYGFGFQYFIIPDPEDSGFKSRRIPLWKIPKVK